MFSGAGSSQRRARTKQLEDNERGQDFSSIQNNFFHSLIYLVQIIEIYR